jgi:hypothetical protein
MRIRRHGTALDDAWPQMRERSAAGFGQRVTIRDRRSGAGRRPQLSPLQAHR